MAEQPTLFPFMPGLVITPRAEPEPTTSAPTRRHHDDSQAELFDAAEIERAPRLEELWAIVEMSAKDGFAEVEPIKWETWWPGGDQQKAGGHIGKRTMMRLRRRGWVEIEKGVATLTQRGWRAAALFEAKGFQR